MNDKAYPTIYADPPWMEPGGGQYKRGADAHYPLMKTAEIVAYMKALPMARDAHLWLWTTNNHLPDGLAVMQALGFRYITNRAWVKTTKDGERVANGLGQYVRGGHELLLFGVRGKVPFKQADNAKRSRCTVSSVILAPRREHSRKPESVYSDIEAVSHGPYLEVFARQRRANWDAYGNEVDKFAEAKEDKTLEDFIADVSKEIERLE